MITPELETYIRQQLGAGVAQDDIRKNLFAKAWDIQDVDNAFAAIAVEGAQQPAQAVTPPVTQQAPVTQVAQEPAQELIQPVKSGGRNGMWAIVVVILLLLGAGGAYAAYSYGLFASATAEQSVIPLSETTLPVATTTEFFGDESSELVTDADNASTTLMIATTTQEVSATTTATTTGN